MIPALAALLALQQLDTADDDAQRQIEALPAAEQALDERAAAALSNVERARTRVESNQQARQALEKDVAAVDTRLARFSDHKAAVKTNVEYTALLHEIDTAQAEKDSLEDRVLELLMEADQIAREVAEAEADAATARREAEDGRREMAAERDRIAAEQARLRDERPRVTAGIEPPLLARYDQLRSHRRGVAVAEMTGETCSACFVRQRPHVAQQVRRNDSIVECESCHRILYAPPPAPDAGLAPT